VADRENDALNCQFSGRDSKQRPKFVTDDKPLRYDSSTKTVHGPMKHGDIEREREKKISSFLLSHVALSFIGHWVMYYSW
jgi:hypothetical protein